MRKILSIVGVALVLGSIYYLVKGLVGHIHEIPPFDWSIGSVVTILLSIFYFVAGVAVQAYIWKMLLRGGGVSIALAPAWSIVGRSQIAKYFPGNVFHFIGRVALGVQEGLSAEAVTLSMGVETVVSALTAALVSVAGLVLLDGERLHVFLLGADIRWRSLVAIAAGVVVLLFILARSNKRVASWIRRRLAYLAPKRILAAAGLFMVFLLLNGVVIKRLLSEVWGTNDHVQWYDYSWGFSVAWLMGFIVPGAPGGIGIREAVFTALFGGRLGIGLAVGVSVLLRIITSLSDVITFVLSAAHRYAGTRKDASGTS